MKCLLFWLLFPIIATAQTKKHQNPLMPIVCGTPILIDGKPDSFLVKIATAKDRRLYKKRVAVIWLDLYRHPLFYDDKGNLLRLKLKK